MADFATWGALSGLDPWQEIRQGKLRDEQRGQIISANADADLQHQKQALQELNDAAQQIGKTDILSFDPNLKDLREKEKDFRSRISEGIKKHNGDISNYMDSTGEIDKQKYINDIVNSDAMQRGKLNSLYYNLANVADQKGMTLRPVSWKEGDETKTGTIGENLQALKDGKTKELNYAGAFTRGTFTPDFHTQYGDKNRYKSVPVTPETFYNRATIQLKGQGFSQQDAQYQAKDLAMQYDKELKSGATPYYFKSDPDPKVTDYWKWFYSSAGRKEEDEDDAIKNLAGVSKKMDDPNSDIWTETIPAGGANAPPRMPGSELIPKATPEIKVTKALNGVKIRPEVIEQTVPTSGGGTKQQYTTIHDNEILTGQNINGVPYVITTASQKNHTIDPKRPLLIPFKSLGSPDLTSEFTKKAEAANKFNKYYGGEKKAEQPKHISTAKLQSLVGTPGYEGLTVKELAKYYADHGYTIQ